MQIVIDIDENTYKDIKGGKVYSSIRDVPQESVLAIANGTPLPKGHGRLIDADYAIKQLLNLPRNELSTEDMWAMSVLDLTPAVIEADEAESE